MQVRHLLSLLSCCLLLSVQTAHTQNTRITLTFDDTPLRDALQTLSSESGINIIFADDLVDGSRVTTFIDQPSFPSALRALLYDAELTYTVSGSGHYIIKDLPRMIVAGVVTDMNNGDFLPYATVRIKGTKYGVRTDSYGYFSLFDIPARPCTLHVQYIGYRSSLTIISDVAPDSLLRIRMTQVALAGEEITVFAESRDIIQVGDAAGEFAVSPYQFDILPVVGEKDLFRSLQLMPGIMTSTASASGVNIRGGASTENLVLLDGMNIYHIGHGFGAVSAFPAEAIKDVRVYKGGFPARFGGRLSGVMELATRTGDMQQPRLKLNANRVSIQGLLETPFNGIGAGMLSVRASHSDDILKEQYRRVFQLSQLSYFKVVPDINEEDLIPDNPSMDFLDILGKVTFLPGNNDILSFSTYVGKDDLRFSETLVESDAVTGLNGLLDNNASWGNLGFSTRWAHRWHDGFRSNLQASFSDFFTRSRIEVTQEPDNITGVSTTDTLEFVNNDVEEWRLRLDQYWQPNHHHQIEFGLILANTRVRFADALFNLDLDAPLVTTYVEDEIRLHSSVRFTAGYRGNYYIPMRVWHHEPRFSLELAAAENTILKGAWGRTYQYVMASPDPEQEYTGLTSWIQADGINLQPSFAEHAVAGLRYFRPAFQFDVEGYLKRLRNILDINGDSFTTEDGAAISQNNGYVAGVDMMIRHTQGPATSWVSYSYSRGRVKPVGGGQRFPMDQDRPHTIKLVGAYDYGAWAFSGTWQYADGTPYSIPELVEIPGSDPSSPSFFLSTSNNRNRRRLPPTHRLDLSVTRSVKYRAFRGKMGVSVFNVYNRENVWSRAFALRNNTLDPVDIKMLGITPTFFVEFGF